MGSMDYLKLMMKQPQLKCYCYIQCPAPFLTSLKSLAHFQVQRSTLLSFLLWCHAFDTFVVVFLDLLKISLFGAVVFLLCQDFLVEPLVYLHAAQTLLQASESAFLRLGALNKKNKQWELSPKPQQSCDFLKGTNLDANLTHNFPKFFTFGTIALSAENGHQMLAIQAKSTEHA